MSDESVKRRYDAPARRAGARATRDRICHAAEELFVLDGYARTSIRAIAAKAGVSEATVYLAFPNKASLLDAAILRAIGQSASEDLAEILTSPPVALLPRLAESHTALMQRAARLIAAADRRLGPATRAIRRLAHRDAGGDVARSAASGEGRTRLGVPPRRLEREQWRRGESNPQLGRAKAACSH
jgi:AcrR family transcriptional regulator